jgi:site-specific DNA-methyltransferase (adenine-specific)
MTTLNQTLESPQDAAGQSLAASPCSPYFECDGVTIYHGDCREILPRLQKAHCILTDPLYGLAGVTEKAGYESFADDEMDVKQLVDFVLASGKAERIVLTPGQKMMFRYPEPNAVGAFFYPAGSGSCSWGFVGWQPIFYYGKDPILQDGRGRAMNSFQSTEAAEKNGHPCPKPVGQWSKLLLRVTREGESVIDPFMGSGTTLVCARNHGRPAIGIEIEEKYCEIAAKRLAQRLLF